MKSDLTCPVEVTGAKIQKNEESGDQVICLIDFLNLSDKAVDSLQMNIICFDDQGSRIGGRLVRAAARGEAQCAFSGVFYPEHVADAARVEASVEKIWFRDGVVWRREERNVREYEPNVLPEGRELDRLRALAGADARGYAREDDQVWLCVCGRANRTSEDRCMRCKRARRQVLAEYSFAAVDMTVGRRERELEEKSRQTIRKASEESARAMEEAEKKQKKRIRLLRNVVIVLALAAVGLAMWRWGVPAGVVYYADYQMNKGQAADAKAGYLWVDGYWPGFMQAGERAAEAERTIIGRLIEANTEQTLTEAAARALSQDESALYEQALLRHAALLQKADKLEAAEKLLDPIADTQSGADMKKALSYEIAAQFMEKTSYPEAIERFAALGDYKDAAEKLPECKELYGRQLMREGDYEAAFDQLMQVSERTGVMEAIRQCRYALAQQKQDKGEVAEAAELYESLGVYEQAEQQAKACRYTLGMRALADGNLERAVEQLLLAGDHEDAAERCADAAGTLGYAALESKDFDQAIKYLEMLPQSEENADAILRAKYGKARKLEDAGASEEAAELYAELGKYEDSEARALAMQYAVAVARQEAGSAEALDRFVALGKYRDSAARADECRNALAEASMLAGDYESALEYYEELGKAGQAGAQRCYYEMGRLCDEAGDFARAAEQYAAAGAYEDAEELTQKALYRHAEALEAKEQYAEAAAVFGRLGSWEDAPKRAKASEDLWLSSVYSGAKMDMELGDYASVVEALAPLADEELPARYAEISQMYVEAAMLRAQALIDMNRPLDALPLLEIAKAHDSKSAAKKLDAYVYQVIGRWKTQRGVEFVFRRDGSCAIDGQEGYFGGKNYDICVSDTKYPTQRTYTVVNLKGKNLTLKNEKTGETLRLSYLGEPTPPVDETTGTTEQTEDKNE